MKKNILVLAIFLFSYSGFSQVGINNTDPKASLDVTATDQGSPANTDGLLIPRVDDFPGTNPGADQQGMMVYLTTTSGGNPPGFYYWDQTTTAWISVVGVKGTLDEAYDQGGAGAGRVINADTGAVSIEGADGFQVTGTQGSGASLALSGAGTRMFFNPRKSAFRAGTVDGTQWNNANIGDYSTASGNNIIASSIYATAFGNAHNVTGTAGTAFGTGHVVDGFVATALGGGNTASGSWSLATGIQTFAIGQGSFSSGEATHANGEHTAVFGFGTQSDASHSLSLGRFNTGGGSNNTWVLTDPVFQIGNGADASNRSNIFTIYKNGRVNINDSYSLPTTDGTANYIMQTDGLGVVSFVNPTTIDTKNTLDQAYDEGGAGTGRIITADNGAVDIQGNDGLLVNTNIGLGNQLFHQGDTNTFIEYTPDRIQMDVGGRNYIDIQHSNQEITFNEDSTQSDFRIESGNNTHMFFVDGSTNNIGVNENNPLVTLDINGTIALHETVSTTTTNPISNFGVGSIPNIGFYSFNNYTSNFSVINIAAGTDGKVLILFNNTVHNFTLRNNFVNPPVYPTQNKVLTLNGQDLVIQGKGMISLIYSTNAQAWLVTSVQDESLDTDDQTIDTFTFNTTSKVLTLEVENDGVAAQTVNLSSLSDADWYEVGTTNAPNAITDDIFTQGNVAIGKITADWSLDIETTDNIATQTMVLGNGGSQIIGHSLENANSGNGTHFGNHSLLSGSGTGDQYASYQEITNTSDGEHFGSYNALHELGDGDHYGASSSLSGSGTGDKYGFHSSITSTSGGIHYGVYSDARKSTGYAGYFIGRMSLGNGSSNRYLMPALDGTANFIMQTNGSGQVSFVNPNTVGINTQNTLDQAYDEGGAGAGRTINTTNGALLLNGADGLEVSGAAANIYVSNTSENESGIHFRDENQPTTQYANILYDSGSSNNLNFYNENVTAMMTLDDNQNVGIGTTTPDHKLSVIGAISAAFETAETNKAQLGHGGANAYINVVGLGRLDFRHEGSNGMSFTDTNRLGIGTTDPDYTLSVSGVTNLKEDDATAGVALRVNGSEALWYDGSRFSWGFGGTSNTFADNLGIGMTSVPSYRLDVRGSSLSNPIANFRNNNDIQQADGIRVQLFNTLPNPSAYYVAFQRDVGSTPTLSGRISGSAAGTGVQYLTTSDRRLKTQITTLQNALDLIKEINPTQYVYKSNPKVIEIGFIAQELKKVYPQAVTGDESGNPTTNPMMVDYSRLTPLLTAGIKELKEEVDTLKQENQKLKQELANYKSLEQRLLVIEEKLK